MSTLTVLPYVAPSVLFLLACTGAILKYGKLKNTVDTLKDEVMPEGESKLVSKEVFDLSQKNIEEKIDGINSTIRGMETNRAMFFNSECNSPWALSRLVSILLIVEFIPSIFSSIFFCDKSNTSFDTNLDSPSSGITSSLSVSTVFLSFPYFRIAPEQARTKTTPEAA